MTSPSSFVPPAGLRYLRKNPLESPFSVSTITPTVTVAPISELMPEPLFESEQEEKYREDPFDSSSDRFTNDEVEIEIDGWCTGQKPTCSHLVSVNKQQPPEILDSIQIQKLLLSHSFSIPPHFQSTHSSPSISFFHPRFSIPSALKHCHRSPGLGSISSSWQSQKSSIFSSCQRGMNSWEEEKEKEEEEEEEEEEESGQEVAVTRMRRPHRDEYRDGNQEERSELKKPMDDELNQVPSEARIGAKWLRFRKAIRSRLHSISERASVKGVAKSKSFPALRRSGFRALPFLDRIDDDSKIGSQPEDEDEDEEKKAPYKRIDIPSVPHTRSRSLPKQRSPPRVFTYEPIPPRLVISDPTSASSGFGLP